MSLKAEIREALQVPAPRESQERVHRAISAQLRELSPEAQVVTTEYFNHSWVPDLVIRRKDAEERPVFLRFDVKHAAFEQDLVFLAEKGPFFLDLITEDESSGSVSHGDGFNLAGAVADKGQEGVLVSEVSAMDELRTRVESNRKAKAATKQIIVGGKGLIDAPAAERIINSWERATAATTEAEVETLRSALNDVEQFLDRASSLDLEADLRAQWVGVGNSAESFPGSEDWQLNDRGPREIAELVDALVEKGEMVPEGEWAEIAQIVSVTKLGHELARLGRRRTGGQVNALVRAAMPYWTARYAYVPPFKSDTLAGEFDWSYGKYAFELNLIARRAFFTDIGRKWARMPKAEFLPDAQSRLENLDKPGVLGAGIVTPEENVSHELRASATGSLAEHLKPFMQQTAAWQAARLRWLDLKVPGMDARAQVNFQRNLVTATESIPLRTFALLVAEHVVGLNELELEQLKETLPATPD